MTQSVIQTLASVALAGAGKMGLAMAGGWIAAGLAPERLTLVDPFAGRAAENFARATGARLVADPTGIECDVLVLAVKPQDMTKILPQWRAAVGTATLVISIAAGVRLAALAEGLGTGRIVRAMPNTPAQLAQGIAGAVALSVSADDRRVADALLGAIGEVIWFGDEVALDAVTAVSGSGPAYVFYFVEALAAAGVREGLPPDAAMRLARQTLVGAAALLAVGDASAASLRENVTSPKGTTAAALEILMAPDGLGALVDRAVAAARRRAEELGR